MREHFLNLKPANAYPVIEKFGDENTAAILYSFLSGDNLLIVHPNSEVRLRFMTFFLSILPSLIFKYNRFTSGCSELDGNENIVGLAELPIKYRSHKKLFLPVDTVFVDLVNLKIEGEGLKNSDYTRKLVKFAKINDYEVRKAIFSFFDDIINNNYNKSKLTNYTYQDHHLIERIEAKLGLRAPIDEEWIMF